ncbi:MAG: tetratricopeptide repeat protein [Phycisphaerales bacterium JB041]
MDDARWVELQRVFTEAVALPAGERAAYLDRACRDNEPLRREIEALLAAHAGSESVLEHATSTEDETLPPSAPAEGAGRAGPATALPAVPGYRIVRELGRGGMGIVYEAERAHPRRMVALKVLRSSFTQPAMRRRFEYEIQLLARLQHPGIAQIFDAGIVPSPDGPIPYFAMELVHGRTLHEIAKDPGLDLRARLELIARIADALHHAHQKGVIHRDLKPGNILIAPDGQPKILDFGVARAVDPDLQMTTMRTEVGQLIGTLPYMSPEQVEGDPGQLDTRSDVYALGVVAYELIAGSLPYDLRNKLIPEAVRVIRQEEPSRLSATNRECRGDVETIIAKSLEKDRERRYQSVAEFASDLRRFLADEPIVARPPSRVYLVRKFAKRHRALVAVSSVALALLVSGAVVSTVLAVRLAGANTSLTDAVNEAGRARAEAQARAESAQAVNEFYTTHLLLAAAPEESLGRDVTIVEALDDAAERVDSELAGQQEAAAFIHRALGSVYRRLNDPDRALHHGERSLELYREALGETDPLTLEMMNIHARVLLEAARYEEAAALREASLKGLRAQLGDSDPATLRVMISHAIVALEYDEVERAIELFEEALPQYEQWPEADAGTLLDYRTSLSQAYDAAGRPDEALALLQSAIDEAKLSMDPDHPTYLKSLNALGASCAMRGDFAGALPITQEIAASAARVLGEGHLNALLAQQNLARTYSALGRFAEAEPIWQDVVPRIVEQLPDPHPLAGAVIKSYGIALAEHDRDEEALPRLLEAYRHIDAAYGNAHPQTQQVIRWLVALYDRAGETENGDRWRSLLAG